MFNTLAKSIAAFVCLVALNIPVSAQWPESIGCTTEQAGQALEIIADNDLAAEYDHIQQRLLDISQREDYEALGDLYLEMATFYNQWREEIEPSFPTCLEVVHFSHTYTVAFTDRLLQVGMYHSMFNMVASDEWVNQVSLVGERVEQNGFMVTVMVNVLELAADE